MPKTQTPAPIDRPLSRAYLREFSGWSTAYPPGISEPTSLRLMENMQVMRDGALRIRPGLKYLSYLSAGVPTDQEIVGTQEPFFLNNGTQAYLVAVREDDDTIGFRVLGDVGAGLVMLGLTTLGVDFVIPQGEAALAFTAATSYVKFLQIDNKIFALSNAGESMRYFTVGANKTAKRLNSIERPAWDVSDKLTVVQPTQAWINSGVPIATRISKLDNQSFETNTAYWSLGETGGDATQTQLERSTTVAHTGGGTASGRLSTRPWITNWMTHPIDETTATAVTGWSAGSGVSGNANVVWNATDKRVQADYITTGAIPMGQRHYLNGPAFPIPRQPSYASSPLQYWAEFDFYTNISSPDMGVSCLVRFYDAGGTQVGSDSHLTPSSITGATYTFFLGTVPSGATQARIFPNIAAYTGGVIWFSNSYWEISNVIVVDDNGVGSGFFSGAAGADYYWAGTTNESKSEYHAAAPVLVKGGSLEVSAGLDYNASAYLRAGTTGRNFKVGISWLDSGGTELSRDYSAVTADVNSAWTRLDVTAAAPTGAVTALLVVESDVSIARNELHYVDHAMFEQASAVGTYFDGSFADTSTEIYDWYTGVAFNGDSRVIEYAAPVGMPTAATPTVNTLIDSVAADNVYNFGFFYTFSNEVGESAASQVTVVKAQRGWSQWKWQTANASAEPSGTETLDPNLCADQLVAHMPAAVFQDAIDQGATKWSLYMMTWSDQDPVPVQAVRLATRSLPTGAAHDAYGYLRMTPQQADANAEVAALPSEVNRFNYSTPSKAGNGLVAADRMVMVFDPAEPAVVRWSSAQMGNYSDFTGSRGGGFKTLSSGNMYVPSAAVLWQNPQSADTITILCLGTDGKSTGYYMAPAQIASQSEAVNIMGFEETTATPGTVSPYGNEVFNNALYHPLDDQLMKSTATNYNINHSTLTDPIQNVWQGLADKHQIVSAVHDNRIYYLVHNPLGETREAGCWGNEVWVFDAAQKAGSWSRWLVQGMSLRRVEQDDQVYMSITRPEGVYFFDPAYTVDDYINVSDELATRAIPWFLETNTQGANRAHDAMAHLVQANIVVGNFLGTMKYGIRGLDIHGKMRTIEKVTRDAGAVSADGLPFDLQDFLLIEKQMSEWFFFAGSTLDDDDNVLPSQGQINLVQYRYTPVTVNVGYGWGSVETFEYGRAGNAEADRNTVNGVPMPFVDTGRP